MNGNGNSTNIGALIDQKLTEKQLTRQGFCDMYEIPLFRLNRMARGEKIHKVDYGRILRLLGLKSETSVFSVFGKNVQNHQNPISKSKISRTPFGWEIKRKLAVLDMTQKEFCEKYDIPTGRMAEIVTGKRLARKHRSRIVDILGIDENEFPTDDDDKK